MAFVLAALVVAGTMWGKKEIKRPESETYKQALAAFEIEDYESALSLLEQELTQNPNNAYAWGYYALSKGNTKEVGEALKAINTCIEKMPKNDPEYVSWGYNIRGQIYQSIGDTTQAISDYSEAVRLWPDNDNNYLSRLFLYIGKKQYDAAMADIDVLVNRDMSSVHYAAIKSGLYSEQGDDTQAMEWANRCVRLDGTDADAFVLRGQLFAKQKKYREAIDDCIKAISLNEGIDKGGLVSELAENAPLAFIAKLKAKAVKEPGNDIWPYYIGVVYETDKQFRKANEYYIISHQKEPAPASAFRIAKCFQEVGDYDNAIRYVEEAISLANGYDNIINEYTYFKGNCENESGRFLEAVADFTSLIEKMPDRDFLFYSRANSYRHLKQYDNALDDINTAISFDPDEPIYYDVRGRVYQLMGNNEKARENFLKVIDTDTTRLQSQAIYAHAFLGNRTQAFDILDKMLEGAHDKNDLYNAACVCAIMNEKGKAMLYLEQAMQAGWRDFSHMDNDEDMNNIRDLKAYTTLMTRYKEILAQEIEQSDDAHYETVTTEVPFTIEGGVNKVKCSINGLPLHFVFDTGASTVTISSVEATFMLKNDYISNKDIVGKNYYSDSQGEVKEGTTINLREVEFGGIVLNDVKANVIHSQKAPLLLGQSVFQKLGSIEIDNDRKVLRVTHRKRAN